MPAVRFRYLIREMHQFEALPGRELAIVRKIFRGTVDSVAFPYTVACQSGSPVTRYDNGNCSSMCSRSSGSREASRV